MRIRSDGNEKPDPTRPGTYVVDLDDGRTITFDHDPETARAIKRAVDAIKAGSRPALADMVVIILWLEQQVEKYDS